MRARNGRVAIADIAWTRVCARRLAALGFIDVRKRRLGWPQSSQKSDLRE
jgi:hypothetical protein